MIATYLNEYDAEPGALVFNISVASVWNGPRLDALNDALLACGLVQPSDKVES